mmetsp:Transcript_21114/g.59024  ORF Transcript_21114/g.59024 Transcript_21114/m.59024 type:complete len:685 (-) Transcript_21114:322-2376(-)
MPRHQRRQQWGAHASRTCKDATGLVHLSTKRTHCTWINKVVIAASETGSVSKTIEAIKEHVFDMNTVNLSTSIHRLAKLCAANPSARVEIKNHLFFGELRDQIHSNLAAVEQSDAKPAVTQTLSNVAWSFALLQFVDPPSLGVVARLAIVNISCFKNYELSSLLWAFAKLHAGNTMVGDMMLLFRVAASKVTESVKDLDFRCLATIAWAYATAKHRNPSLFRALSLQMQQEICSTTPQEVSNSAWAFGTVGHRDDRLFQALAQAALRRLEDFKAQEISNTLWGFATNGFFHEAFFEEALFQTSILELNPQNFANIMWAYARVRPDHPSTRVALLALLPRCAPQLGLFKAQELSSVVNAIAKVFGQRDLIDETLPLSFSTQRQEPWDPIVLDFIRALAPWAAQHSHHFSDQSLANLVSALFLLRSDEVLGTCRAIEDAVLVRASSLGPSGAVVLLSAFLAHPSKGQRAIACLAARLMASFCALTPRDFEALTRLHPASQAHGASSGVKGLTCEDLHSWCSVLLVSGGCMPSPEEEAECHGLRGEFKAAGCNDTWGSSTDGIGDDDTLKSQLLGAGPVSQQPQGKSVPRGPDPPAKQLMMDELGASSAVQRSDAGSARCHVCVKNTFIEVFDISDDQHAVRIRAATFLSEQPRSLARLSRAPTTQDTIHEGNAVGSERVEAMLRGL